MAPSTSSSSSLRSASSSSPAHSAAMGMAMGGSWDALEAEEMLDNDGEEEERPLYPVVHQKFCSHKHECLTVRKKPMVFSGGGFTVTDSDGQLVFTVDGRGPSKRQKVLLMDGHGKPLLTVKRRKGLNVYDRWDAYLGESTDEKVRVFSIKESSMFSGGFEIYLIERGHKRKPFEYRCKGCYLERNCTIYKSPKIIVAEIRRKAATSEIMLSKDVYNVVIKAGIDHAFIMGIIVILHQIAAEDG